MIFVVSVILNHCCASSAIQTKQWEISDLYICRSINNVLMNAQESLVTIWCTKYTNPSRFLLKLSSQLSDIFLNSFLQALRWIFYTYLKKLSVLVMKKLRVWETKVKNNSTKECAFYQNERVKINLSYFQIFN